MIAAFVARWVIKFPNTANHANLAILMGSFLLAPSIVRNVFRSKAGNHKNIDAGPIAAVRAIATCVYFWAAFHKLNTDFFNPEVSSAVWYLDKLHGVVTGQHISDAWLTALAPYAIWSAILTEGFIFIFLLVPRFRKLGICVGCALHLFLSLGGFADFGLIMIGAYASFLPDTPFQDQRKIKVGLSVMATGLLLATIFRYGFEQWMNFSPEFSEFTFGIIAAPIFALSCLAFALNSDLCSIDNAPKRYSIVAFFVLCLWCLFPYIGLSNQGNLTMFSNLITFADRSNHLIINTRKTKIFAFEEDVVEILEIDGFARFHSNQDVTRSYLPLVSFSRSVELWKRHNSAPNGIVFRYRDEEHTVEDLDDFLPQNPFASRFLLFRMTPKTGPMKTSW